MNEELYKSNSEFINYLISNLKIENILILINDNKYKLNGELEFSYKNNYKFNISKLIIASEKWPDKLTLSSGLLKLSKKELSIIDLESKTDWFSFKVYKSNINFTELNHSTMNLIIIIYIII